MVRSHRRRLITQMRPSSERLRAFSSPGANSSSIEFARLRFRRACTARWRYNSSRMKELQGALRRLQIQNLETLLALADLEETALTVEIQSPHTSEERRIAAKNRLYEIPIEKEIVLTRLADLNPPLRVAAE